MAYDPGTQGRRYGSLWERLMANTAKPDSDNGCWCWTGRKRSSYGYGRFNLYVPELARNVPLTAHVASWVMLETGITAPYPLHLACLELRHSGLQLDHLCETTKCINPDHLDLVTPRQNAQRRYRR